jgi:hypothetical protein
LVIHRAAGAACLALVVAAAAGACADLVGIPERFYAPDSGALDGTSGGTTDGASEGGVSGGDDRSVLPDQVTGSDQHAPGDGGPSGGDAPSSGDGRVPGFPFGDGGCPACTDSGLCLLACNQDNPSSLALDTTGVYWSNAGHFADGYAGSAVQQMAKSGSNLSRLAADPMSRPGGVAVSGGCVVWNESLKGKIVEQCGPTVSTPVSNLGGGVSLTLSGSTLVWATNAGGNDLILDCTVPSCTTRKTLAVNRTSPFALGVDTSSGDLFWLESSGGSGGVYACSLTGCTASSQAATAGPALSLALVSGGSFVYTSGTAGATDGTIDFYFFPVGYTYLQASGRSSPTGIATDGTSICWAEPGSGSDGQVLCCDLAYGNPCTPHTLATGLPFPSAVAIDATRAYWVNGGAPDAATGSVMSSPR